MLIGLCFLPAALGEPHDADLLELGACQFSLGTLIVAAGIYAKARGVQLAIASGEPRKEPAVSNPRVRGGCDLCGTEAPVVQCQTHKNHMCGSCLAKHYHRSCVYVPTTRTASNKAGNFAASARGA
jgi:hypothetical protein